MMSRISRRTFLRTTGGAATFGVLAGCTGGDGGGDGNGDGDGGGDGNGDGDGGTEATPTGTPTMASEPITIGGIEPLSGPFTPWGNAHQAGLQFAVNEINADGGVMGRDLELTISDTGSDPAEADSIFRRFVENEDAVAVTGPVSSDVGIRTSQTAEDLGVPNMLHMAGSNDSITADTTHTFRLGILPATTGIQAQAGLIENAGYSASDVGAIIADYGWGRSVEAAINAEFPFDIQIEVAPVGASDFKSQIRAFPDDLSLMVATGHPPGSLTIANQMFELGYEPENITGPGFPPAVIWGALSDSAIGNFTHIHNSDPFTDQFAEIGERFASEMDSQFSTHSAYGYVTANVLAAAIENAGEDAPGAIRDALTAQEYDTLFANPINWTDHGEIEGGIQIYSQLRSDGPSYYPDGAFHLEEQFRTDPLPALPPEE
jgi:branched-chain amino acid transport system substrate-binding protein